MASPRTVDQHAGVHVFPLRVYYEDTDAAGIVYHASYLRFAERARTEMLRAAGLPPSLLLEREGRMFIVRRCTVDFLKPARLDDALEVASRILAARGARVEAEQVIRRGGEEIARLVLELACVDRDGRPARLPRALNDSFNGAAGSGPRAARDPIPVGRQGVRP